MEKLLITTEKLRIRNLEPDDLTDFHGYRSNPEVTRYQGFDVMTLPQAAEFIESQADKLFGQAGEWVQYAVERKEDHRLVGDCAIKLDHYEPRIAEIGLTISPLHQRNGYAREVLKGILGWLFEVKMIHRVVEIVDVRNEASIRLLESVGFRKEGYFLENIFFKGEWGSEYQYALLRREWLQLSGNYPS